MKVRNKKKTKLGQCLVLNSKMMSNHTCQHQNAVKKLVMKGRGWLKIVEHGISLAVKMNILRIAFDLHDFCICV